MKGGAVLVIEDHADVRDGIAQLLRAHGYEALTAANGAQGVEVLRSSPTRPFLILLDVMMPVMNAGDFRKTLLRDHPELADIPIVLVTALPYEVRAVRQFPGATYLGKPFDPKKLIELVERHSPRAVIPG